MVKSQKTKSEDKRKPKHGLDGARPSKGKGNMRDAATVSSSCCPKRIIAYLKRLTHEDSNRRNCLAGQEAADVQEDGQERQKGQDHITGRDLAAVARFLNVFGSGRNGRNSGLAEIQVWQKRLEWKLRLQGSEQDRLTHCCPTRWPVPLTSYGLSRLR